LTLILTRTLEFRGDNKLRKPAQDGNDKPEAIEKILIYSSEYQSYSDFLWANDQKDFNVTAYSMFIKISLNIENQSHDR